MAPAVAHAQEELPLGAAEPAENDPGDAEACRAFLDPPDEAALQASAVVRRQHRHVAQRRRLALRSGALAEREPGADDLPVQLRDQDQRPVLGKPAGHLQESSRTGMTASIPLAGVRKTKHSGTVTGCGEAGGGPCSSLRGARSLRAL